MRTSPRTVAFTSVVGLALGLQVLALSEAAAQGRGPAANKTEGTRSYIVQPGDSCWSIALKIFGKGEEYRIIHRFNDLGPLPHILKPGQVLRLPGQGTGPEARVTWLQREVKAKAPTMVDWLAAHKDMGLWQLYKVFTGSDSAAGILFEDSSSLSLREQALLVIFGGSASRARLKRRDSPDVVVEKGVVRGGLGRLDQQAALRIGTPSAQVVLRSRSTQVEVDEQQSAMVSVYDGQAEVAAKGERVLVPTDHGTRVRKGEAPERPRPLPASPRFTEGLVPRVAVVPAGQSASFRIGWQPVKGAARYRSELAKDAEFHFPLAVNQVPPSEGDLGVATPPLPAGLYHARVAAIDSAKLEGRSSEVLQLEVLELSASRLLRPLSDGAYEVVGLVSLSLPPARAAEIEVAQDGTGTFAPLDRPLVIAAPGDHRLRFRRVGGQAGSELRLRLLRVSGRLDSGAKTLQVKSEPTSVTLHVVDEKGQPAALPGLGLVAYPGGALTLTPLGPGVYRASCPAPLAYEARSVVVVAAWPGGELARMSIPVEEPPRAPDPVPMLPPPPPEVRFRDEPVGLQGMRAGPGLPSRAARPMTGLGLGVWVSQQAGKEELARDPSSLGDGQDRDIYLRSSLRGEVALLSQTLGIDLEFPFFEDNISEDTAGSSDLGDLRLGARFLALDRAGLALSPSLRVTAPTGGYERDRHGTLLEPALLVEWLGRGLLYLATNQGLVVDLAPEGDPGVHYAATYTAGLRWRRLSIGAELATVIGLVEPVLESPLLALGLGGAARLHLGDLRLGVVGGGGLNDDGRLLVGRFSVGLVADLDFAWP